MTGDDRLPEADLDQATGWIVRLHDQPDDEALRAQFEAWLAGSPDHVRAWTAAEAAWQRMGEVPAAFAQDWPARTAKSPPRQTAPGRPPRRLTMRRAALAMAACLLLALAAPSLLQWLAADFRTATAEMRSIPLADGSIVHLAPDSAIGTHFVEDRRGVTLLRGEAFFEVMPDKARPFTVRAAGADVTVTGTSFDVGVTDRSLSVAVASGSVRVTRPAQAQEGAAASASATQADLAPGQGLVIDRPSGEVLATAASPAAVASWRSGRLIVENALLSDVVAAIGRFHTGAILVTDPALRDKRVTGGYDLGDPERALRVLAAPYHGRVRVLTRYLLVLSAG